MNLRQPGWALLLKRMMMVNAVPAVMSVGLGVLQRLMAMMAEVSLVSSPGLEKGSHARVGVERLNPIAERRIVDMVSVVKACKRAGGTRVVRFSVLSI
jgi:hypothetical protein